MQAREVAPVQQGRGPAGAPAARASMSAMVRMLALIRSFV
jgi:hypothetical protein